MKLRAACLAFCAAAAQAATPNPVIKAPLESTGNALLELTGKDAP